MPIVKLTITKVTITRPNDYEYRSAKPAKAVDLTLMTHEGVEHTLHVGVPKYFNAGADELKAFGLAVQQDWDNLPPFDREVSGIFSPFEDGLDDLDPFEGVSTKGGFKVKVWISVELFDDAAFAIAPELEPLGTIPSFPRLNSVPIVPSNQQVSTNVGAELNLVSPPWLCQPGNFSGDLWHVGAALCLKDDLRLVVLKTKPTICNFRLRFGEIEEAVLLQAAKFSVSSFAEHVVTSDAWVDEIQGVALGRLYVDLILDFVVDSGELGEEAEARSVRYRGQASFTLATVKTEEQTLTLSPCATRLGEDDWEPLDEDALPAAKKVALALEVTSMIDWDHEWDVEGAIHDVRLFLRTLFGNLRTQTPALCRWAMLSVEENFTKNYWKIDEIMRASLPNLVALMTRRIALLRLLLHRRLGEHRRVALVTAIADILKQAKKTGNHVTEDAVLDRSAEHFAAFFVGQAMAYAESKDFFKQASSVKRLKFVAKSTQFLGFYRNCGIASERVLHAYHDVKGQVASTLSFQKCRDAVGESLRLSTPGDPKCGMTYSATSILMSEVQKRGLEPVRSLLISKFTGPRVELPEYLRKELDKLEQLASNKRVLLLKMRPMDYHPEHGTSLSVYVQVCKFAKRHGLTVVRVGAPKLSKLEGGKAVPLADGEIPSKKYPSELFDLYSEEAPDASIMPVEAPGWCTATVWAEIAKMENVVGMLGGMSGSIDIAAFMGVRIFCWDVALERHAALENPQHAFHKAKLAIARRNDRLRLLLSYPFMSIGSVQVDELIKTEGRPLNEQALKVWLDGGHVIPKLSKQAIAEFGQAKCKVKARSQGPTEEAHDAFLFEDCSRIIAALKSVADQ